MAACTHDASCKTPPVVPTDLAPPDLQADQGPHRLQSHGSVGCSDLSCLVVQSIKVMIRIPFKPPTPKATIVMVAYLPGWGAHLDHCMVQGTWTLREARLLRAVRLSCKAFLFLIYDLHIQILSDNIAMVVCMNKQGAGGDQISFPLLRVDQTV